MHHVAVGQDEAVRREEEAGTATTGLARTLRRLHSVVDFNVDHRWADLIGSGYNGLRVGVEQLVIVQRLRAGEKFN
jgi:hypothetical protein